MPRASAHIAIGCVLLLGLFLVMSGFSKRDRSITLSYTINYPGDSWEKNRTGFLWALSYLGAGLPEGSFDKSLRWQDSSSFRLELDGLGFSKPALEALCQITDSLKRTEQYRKRGSIDLGQFVALTIGSSWHYYAITGMPSRYEAFLAQHGGKAMQVFPLMQSTVASHSRRIRFHEGRPVQSSVFIAEEGAVPLPDSSFAPEVYEVMDVMPNGQLRFAVYDRQGDLCASSPKQLGAAGKPAKCLWCHELVVQPLFRKTDSLQGQMSPAQFQGIVAALNRELSLYRQGLRSEIRFLNTQDHTYMELLYISYMEPSLQKLSKEWGVPETELRLLLQAEEVHQHEEFDFLKERYTRGAIARYAPCLWNAVADDLREPCSNEPAFIKPKKP